MAIAPPETAPHVSLAPPIPRPSPSDARKQTSSSAPRRGASAQTTHWAQLKLRSCSARARATRSAVSFKAGSSHETDPLMIPRFHPPDGAGRVWGGARCRRGCGRSRARGALLRAGPHARRRAVARRAAAQTRGGPDVRRPGRAAVQARGSTGVRKPRCAAAWVCGSPDVRRLRREAAQARGSPGARPRKRAGRARRPALARRREGGGSPPRAAKAARRSRVRRWSCPSRTLRPRAGQTSRSGHGSRRGSARGSRCRRSRLARCRWRTGRRWARPRR